MVAEKGGFITVQFERLSLPVPNAAFSCGEDGCLSQQVSALVHSLQWVRVQFGLCVVLPVAATETHFSILFQTNIARLAHYDIAGSINPP